MCEADFPNSILDDPTSGKMSLCFYRVILFTVVTNITGRCEIFIMTEYEASKYFSPLEP